jgi:hypothetical protein
MGCAMNASLWYKTGEAISTEGRAFFHVGGLNGLTFFAPQVPPAKLHKLDILCILPHLDSEFVLPQCRSLMALLSPSPSPSPFSVSTFATNHTCLHTCLPLTCMQINMASNPLWGRNMECPGEDPHVSSVFAYNYVKVSVGVRVSLRVRACVRIHMHVRVYVGVCTHTYVRIPLRVCGFVCGFACAFACTFVCAFVCAFVCTFACAFVCACAFMHVMPQQYRNYTGNAR